MPITELVFSVFRPEAAKEGFAAITTSVPKYIGGLPGILLSRVGHILKHNGNDVSSEHRAVLGIEWDNPESFHHFYPASPEFGEFVGTINPFLGGKPTPQLFTPGPGKSRSNATFESTITHIFTAQLGDKKDEVSSAWDNLVAALRNEGLEPKEWSGWGIEEAEGVWLGIIGGDDIEKIEAATAKVVPVQVMKNLKDLGDVEDFVVDFRN